jgi:hypothetical protein
VYIYTQSTFILAPRNTGLLGLKSGLGPARPASPYTVGLSVISNKTIDGVGSVSYLNQSSPSFSRGAATVVNSYYAQVEGNDYFDVEGDQYYYETTFL